MPEYLAPGVYVEETSYRAKSIEGVATSTAGFVGQCRYGPVEGRPQLITSFEEFQRYFGSIEELVIGGSRTNNFLAHAVQLFFANGGKRVYIARIFLPDGAPIDDYRASGNELVGGTARLKARFPGRAGNLKVFVEGVRSGNLLTEGDDGRVVRGLRAGDVAEVFELTGDATPKARRVSVNGGDDALDASAIRTARLNDEGQIILTDAAGNDFDVNVSGNWSVQKVSLTMRVASPDGREETYQGLSTHPDSQVFVGKVMRHQDPAEGVEPPADRTARVFHEIDTTPSEEQAARVFARDLIEALLTAFRATIVGNWEGSSGEFWFRTKARTNLP